MIKTIALFILLIATLYARENPFVSTQNGSMPLTSNQEISIDPLKQASITLPSTARVIESVTIKYKNLDGSEKSQKILLNNSVDWHIPIFISQNYNLQKNKRTKKHFTKKKNIPFKKLLSLNFIKIYQSSKTLKVITDDTIIRDFLLVKPHRIVFDIKKEIDIRSHVKKLSKNSIFTNIKIGNHKGYYRVVVELDGYYTYKLSHSKNSYFFTLR